MAERYDSELAKKLNVKSGVEVRVVGKPEEVELAGVATTDAADAGGVLVFARTLAEAEDRCAPLVESARADGVAWMAYPKAGQLGTDLNRDILWRHMLAKGIKPVRQVALDDVWSAMRFRPGA